MKFADRNFTSILCSILHENADSSITLRRSTQCYCLLCTSLKMYNVPAKIKQTAYFKYTSNLSIQYFFFAITAISELNSNLCNRQCSFKILPQLAASFWFYVIFLNVVTSIKLRRFDFVNNDTWISAELNTFSPPLTNNCIHFNPFELIESLETLGLVTNCTWLLTDNTHKHTHIMWNVQKYFHRLQLN